MATVTYKSCAVTGSAASFVLRLQEAVAAQQGAAKAALAGLNALTVPSVDEPVKFNGVLPFSLAQTPIDGIDIYSSPGRRGTLYKTKSEYFGVNQSNSYFKFDETGATDKLADYGTNNRSLAITGSIPRTGTGPLGKSALFTSGNYFSAITPNPILGVSPESVNVRYKEGMLAFGWVKVDLVTANRGNIVCYGGVNTSNDPLYNNVYQLKINNSGKFEFSWQLREKQTYSITHTTTVQNGKFYFVAARRLKRRLTGTVSIVNNTKTVIGSGTTFLTDFLPLQWVQFGADSKSYRINKITSDTSMELFENHTGTITTDLPGAVFVLDADLWVGDTFGNFTQELFPKVPVAEGGSKSSLYVGYDPETTNGLNGQLCGLALLQSPKTTNDFITSAYSKSFPDFVLSGKTVTRTPTSSLPVDTTVFGNYRYTTNLAGVQATLASLTQSVDGILSNSQNAEISSLSTLATNLGTLDPALIHDANYLETFLTPFGIVVANGRAFMGGSIETASYRKLVYTLNGDFDRAKELTFDKPTGSFVLTASRETQTEKSVRDACGVISTQLVITETLIAVNLPKSECARLAGLQTADKLKFRLFWLGAVPKASTGIGQRLRSFDFTSAEVQAILAVTNINNTETYLIADKNLPDSFAGNSTDIHKMIIDRPNTGVTTAPTTAQIALTLNAALDAVAPLTTDGTQNPMDPGSVLAGVVNPITTFELNTDLAQAAAIAAGEICQSIFMALMSSVDALMGIFKSIQFTIAPISLQLGVTVKLIDLSFSRYIPCLMNVSGSVGSSVMSATVNVSAAKLNFMEAQVQAIKDVVQGSVTSIHALMCIPETIINAILGGVCGFQVPQSNCREIDALRELMLKIRNLLLAIRKILLKLLTLLGTVLLDINIAKTSAVKIKVELDSCAQDVAIFLNSLLLP